MVSNDLDGGGAGCTKHHQLQLLDSLPLVIFSGRQAQPTGGASDCTGRHPGGAGDAPATVVISGQDLFSVVDVQVELMMVMTAAGQRQKHRRRQRWLHGLSSRGGSESRMQTRFRFSFSSDLVRVSRRGRFESTQSNGSAESTRSTRSAGQTQSIGQSQTTSQARSNQSTVVNWSTQDPEYYRCMLANSRSWNDNSESR
ncbi:hypothetical protein HanXRQr2_Chr16g0748301 [Helianthus annuus]|uniref:Uncharacterized protein n=1 Tax=Helianthus annuus TaxID=4232 RepID=A0A251SNX2_HELAN|nr:uncharacterized protein LOC110902426 [Helianthus annuus]KAF5760011.1 hypothetical protein HanXRQr2_Chr16g0748301 [Helianthus annuus]